MSSHDPSKPSYKESTSDEYKALFRRIELAFDPEEMTKDRLIEWLNNETLADMFAITEEIYQNIEEAKTIEELKELKIEVRLSKTHQTELLDKIEEKIEELKIEEKEEIIAVGITNVEEFAESRKIKLTETIIGRIELWKDGKERFVIREQGRLKAWKII